MLIVDDHRSVADSLPMVLDIKGHDIRVMYSAEACLEHVVEFRPEIVLVGIRSTAMDDARQRSAAAALSRT